MFLVNFNPNTGRVLSAGLVAAEVLPAVLPAGTIAVEKLPAGRASDYLYRDGTFVLESVQPAQEEGDKANDNGSAD